MATLASIRKQIADLEKKAEALVKAETSQVVAKVKELIDRYDLTAEDLGLAGKREKKGPGKRAAAKVKKTGATAVGVPMYRDPKSGKTWTGRGKPPAWIADAKDRASFLIDAGSGAAAAEEKPAVKVVRKKASAAKTVRTPKEATAKAGKSRVASKAVTAATTPAAKKPASGKSPKKASAAPKKPAEAVTPRKARKSAGSAGKSPVSTPEAAPAGAAPAA